MYTRKELLSQLRERLANQIKIVNKRPNDNVAYQHLSDVRRHIQSIVNTHFLTKNESYLLFENNDYRVSGDDHSEVSKIPIFRCCQGCCQALQFWIKEQTGKLSGIYYSIGNDKGEELNKKIVVYAGRTLAQSMDSDEMRVNNEWLE